MMKEIFPPPNPLYEGDAKTQKIRNHFDSGSELIIFVCFIDEILRFAQEGLLTDLYFPLKNNLSPSK